MDAGLAKRMRVACAVAVAAIGAATVALAPGAVAGPATLMPDLIALSNEQDQMIVTKEGGKTLLRLTTEIANVGNGPLEVFPSATGSDCDANGSATDDRDAYQRFFADTNGSGGYEPDADGVASERQFGCLHYHAAHGHWHLLDFAHYELRRDPGGRLVSRSTKIGFCLVDDRNVFPGPFAPEHPHYPFGSASSQVGCDEHATQGISVGWADAYAFSVPGQSLDVTGLKRGHYCLISTTDPLDVLEESNESNNTRRVRLALRPKRFSVRKLIGGCRE